MSGSRNGDEKRWRKMRKIRRRYVYYPLLFNTVFLSVLYNLLRKVFFGRLHFATHYSPCKRSHRAQMGTEKKQNDATYF